MYSNNPAKQRYEELKENALFQQCISTLYSEPIDPDPSAFDGMKQLLVKQNPGLTMEQLNSDLRIWNCYRSKTILTPQ